MGISDSTPVVGLIDTTAASLSSHPRKHSSIANIISELVSHTQPIFGKNTAISGFTRSMIRWLPYNLLVATQSKNVPILQKQLSDRELDKRVTVCSILDLPYIYKTKHWLAWLDDTNVFPALDLRASIGERPYPILFSHHTVSYGELLHGYFLPLLLAGTANYDSFVCTSNSARKLVNNILDHVTEGLRRTRDIDLTFQGRLDVIPLGVDTETYKPRDSRVCRKHFGLPTKGVLALYVGRLSAIDKADLFPLVQVFAEIRSRHPEKRLYLVIAGNGFQNYDKLLRKVVKDAGMSMNVLFLPGINDEEMPLLYCSADVFVSPIDNIQECFGQTPVEAMASGIPQVVSDWDGYRETVVDGTTGFLIPSIWSKCDSDLNLNPLAGMDDWQMDHFRLAQSVAIDRNVWINRLEALMLNEKLRKDMGAASRERAVSCFDWKVVVSKYSDLIEDLSKQAASSWHSRVDHRQYSRPNYFECAKHFATRILDNSSLVISCAKLDCHKVIFPYRGAFGYFEEFDNWKLESVLALACKPISVGRLVEQVMKKSDCGEDCARRGIMWLIKYSYLATV